MKKLKIIVVSLLAVILCFMCVTTSTFSWFTRPQSLQGDHLGLDFNYDISTGTGITMRTYASIDDGKTYVETTGSEITDFSNADGLAAGTRVCYRTDIINSGTAPQSVSLFLTKLEFAEDTSGSFYLGVNGPLKTYKNYYGDSSLTSDKQAVTINQKNVYVGFYNANTYTPTNYQIHWWDSSKSSYNGNSEVQPYFSPEKTGTWNSKTYKMSYATIPWDANAVKLRKGDTWYGNDNTDIVTYNTVAFDGNSTYVTSGKSAGINTFYSSATLKVGDSIDLAAEAQGKTITYSSSNTGVATVDSNGTVSGVSAGTSVITVKATGTYGDVMTASCTVTVSSADGNAKRDVPVVTNVKVDGKYADGEPGMESVYWYIKNDSASGTLKYTIEELYLTL
ncbi:Ig-like domain-containing protein [Ruminococcus sp.]|uniref:Ig-like domain-containing protein n=1 Tax=Ruminococcus sp. TaxID=41978 RepID=UPI003F12801C